MDSATVLSEVVPGGRDESVRVRGARGTESDWVRRREAPWVEEGEEGVLIRGLRRGRGAGEVVQVEGEGDGTSVLGGGDEEGTERVRVSVMIGLGDRGSSAVFGPGVGIFEGAGYGLQGRKWERR